MGGDESDEVEAQIAAIDREFGLVPNRPVVESQFPNLAGRVNVAAVLHERDPAEKLVTVADRFELLAPLGEGGFGTVVKARDARLDRSVALKLCPAWHPDAEKAVQREAQALAKLQHPNIIAIHDVGRYEEEDALFLVTQYVQAVSLHAYAVRARRPWREVLELFLIAGDALAAAHQAGVVHGDFKPENVIIEEQTKTPYIVDFGLARILAPGAEQLERAAKRGGTLHYMAPELLRGGGSSELTDQYAFCVSLWRCLDHQPPYIGDNTDELLEDIEVMGEDVCFIDKTIPDRLRELLVVGLDQRPERRHSSMRALLRELELLRGPVVVAEPTEAPGLFEREDMADKPPYGAAAGLGKAEKGLVYGLLVFVTVGGVLGELYYTDRSARPSPQPTTEVQEPTTEIQERAPDHRKLAEADFLEAQRLLAEDDVRRSHATWYAAKSRMARVDRRRAAKMSIELSRAFDDHLDCNTSEDENETETGEENEDDSPDICAASIILGAWIAADAAESYELESLWPSATEAREHAAAMFVDARALRFAKEQLACADLNRVARSCED